MKRKKITTILKNGLLYRQWFRALFFKISGTLDPNNILTIGFGFIKKFCNIIAPP